VEDLFATLEAHENARHQERRLTVLARHYDDDLAERPALAALARDVAGGDLLPRHEPDAELGRSLLVLR
jgi:hypothetical protein